METKVAMYLRLSNEDADKEEQQESNSIVAQRGLITAKIAELMIGETYEIVEYCDDGYTGTNFERPSFQQMMTDARQGRFQMIVVKDFSRFGRDYIEVGRYLEFIFPILQIRFVSVNDGYDSLNKFGTTGGMSVALKNLVYGMYSADLSKKVRSARNTRVRNGEFVGQFAPYGYMKDPDDKHKIIVDEEVRWVVDKIFTMAVSGINCQAIARWLNDHNVPSPYAYKRLKKSNYPDHWEHSKKKLWCNSTISGMIKNEFYLGKLLWNRKKCGIDTGHKAVSQDRENWIIVENHHEALVSEELFAKANATITKWKIDRKPVSKSKNLFICGHCGRVLGKNHKYYKCRNRNAESDTLCKNVTVDQIEIESMVLEQVRTIVSVMIGKQSAGAKKQTLNQKEELTSLIEQNQQEIASWKNTKLSLYEQYKAERLSREAYKLKIEQGNLRVEQMTQQVEDAKNELASLSVSENTTKEEDAMLEDLQELSTYDGTKLSNLIDKVVVYDREHIEIQWKIADPLVSVVM